MLALWVGVMYGVAQWYILRHSDEPVQLGVTFIPRYARYFDLDPKDTLGAMIHDLGVRRFRLVSYWDDIEKSQGQYDFTELDWQFDMVEQAGGEVSLSIGLRQPRWPECHMPQWAAEKPMSEWSVDLKEYIRVVMERYKGRKVLTSYQLENEFFMEVFGICPDHTRERLIDEFNFVKQTDPTRPVIVSRSNNWIGFPYNEPRADKVGIAVYKRVWDQTITKRYFEYPLPAKFYAMLAGFTEIFTDRNMMIHELQAEPWMPDGFDMATSSIEEQDKSMNAERLKDRFQYARDTGMKEIDLWGAEWWYWRMVKHNDPSLWNVAKEEFAKHHDRTRYQQRTD